MSFPSTPPLFLRVSSFAGKWRTKTRRCGRGEGVVGVCTDTTPIPNPIMHTIGEKKERKQTRKREREGARGVFAGFMSI